MSNEVSLGDFATPALRETLKAWGMNQGQCFIALLVILFS